jgi:predicted nucleic acid-binding protein
MPSPSRKLYWDACIFLHYINAEPRWVGIIEKLLEGASKSDGELLIVTSIISKVEVAFAGFEQRHGKLSKTAEQKIDKLWNDYTAILPIEVFDKITSDARQLVRKANILKPKLALKPMDAIHFASAMYLAVDEFHTTDPKLLNPKYATLTGLKIKNPDLLHLPYRS